MYFKKPKIGELEDEYIGIIDDDNNNKGIEEDRGNQGDILGLEEETLGEDLEEEDLEYNPDDFPQDSIRDMFDDKKGIFNMLLLFIFFIGIILFYYYRFYIN